MINSSNNLLSAGCNFSGFCNKFNTSGVNGVVFTVSCRYISYNIYNPTILCFRFNNYKYI